MSEFIWQSSIAMDCSTDFYFHWYISMHQTQDEYNSFMLVLLIHFPFPAQNILLGMPRHSSITEISKKKWNFDLFRLANEPILWPKWDSNLFRAVKLSISRGIRGGSKTQYRPINPLRSTLIVLMCRHLRTRKGGYNDYQDYKTPNQMRIKLEGGVFKAIHKDQIKSL